MSVNTIPNTSVNDAYTSTASKTNTTKNNSTSNVENSAASSAAASESKKTETSSSEASKKNENTAAVYDKTKLSEDDRKAIVDQLKADQEKRQSQLADLVSNMMNKQTNMYGQANNMWRFLASGQFTVDAETKSKAQQAISEDGYWGVKQTSDRIVQFATALAGDDSKALEKMRDAFLKGYKQAEKTWGGKLPDISQRTYDAVLEKFDKLMAPKTEETDNSTNNSSSSNNSNNSITTEDGTVVVKGV